MSKISIASTTYLKGTRIFFKNMSECYFKERYSVNNAYLAEVCSQMISIESENNDRNVRKNAAQNYDIVQVWT